MKAVSLLSGYLFLVLAIITGVASNGFLKTTEGFTKISPTIFCVTSIIICIFCLSKAMTIIPVGFTYATYGGLTTIGVTLFGLLRFNQIPNFYATIGIIFILIGVVMVNYFGKLSN